MKTILLLALTAPLLASPVPYRDVKVKYTANYPNPPTPHAPPPKKDLLEEDTPSQSTNDLESILSVQKPLPSIFLMNLSKLRAERTQESEVERIGEVEAVKAGEEALEVVSEKVDEPLDPMESAREPPAARELDEERPVWVSDARHLCPFAALVVFWTLGFLACAVQRWRKPRGEIYLHIEKPKRESLSLRADEEVVEAQ